MPTRTAPASAPVSATPVPVTWLSAPRRLPLSRLRFLGPIVLALHDWSRANPGEPRMFDQRLLECVTRVHPAIMPAVYVPVAVWLFWRTSRLGRFLRSYHLQHHHSTPERRFGVSTPFWDHGFRTRC